MTPVDQTITGDGGNCYQAALASVLELPLADVPHFRATHPDDMHGAAARWLKGWGVRLLPMYFTDRDDLARTHFDFSMYVLVAGYGPRRRADGSRRQHAVVGRTLPWGVELLHDPHPDKTFLADEGHRWVTLVVFPPTHPLCRDSVEGICPASA